MSAASKAYQPASAEQLAELIGDSPRVKIVGGCSKPALCTVPSGVAECSLISLAGIVEYEPSEFVVTARAGTMLVELQAALAAHGQAMPFDPPFANRGATIGGTVAAGLSGAGRLRFGGLRDFIVGAKSVDGLGQIVTSGGRVVKNAAGYDIPKLLVGSCGVLGPIVEVTLKVFPKPSHSRTWKLSFATFADATKFQTWLSRSPLELAALDLTSAAELCLRGEGSTAAIEATQARLQAIVDDWETTIKFQAIEDADQIWGPLRDGNFATLPERFVRVPLAPSQVVAVDQSLAEMSVKRRYSAAGNVAWIVWPGPQPMQRLDECLRRHDLGGTILMGEVVQYRIGKRPNASMFARVKAAFDPQGKFVDS